MSEASPVQRHEKLKLAYDALQIGQVLAIGGSISISQTIHVLNTTKNS